MSREPYTMEPHAFISLRCLPWPICSKCGLVRLRNPFTDWSVRKGCNSEDHPSYIAVMHKFTSPDGQTR